MASTARSLKEHFILEKIAEAENVSESAADYDAEIKAIASQSGESPRRVRASLERKGLMDVLRNQIIERKTIDLVTSKAEFKDIPFEFPNLMLKQSTTLFVVSQPVKMKFQPHRLLMKIFLHDLCTLFFLIHLYALLKVAHACPKVSIIIIQLSN